MTIKELRTASGMDRKVFAEYFNIPYRTLQNWELGTRDCPQYLLDLMEYKLRKENKIKTDELIVKVANVMGEVVDEILNQ